MVYALMVYALKMQITEKHRYIWRFYTHEYDVCARCSDAQMPKSSYLHIFHEDYANLIYQS